MYKEAITLITFIANLVTGSASIGGSDITPISQQTTTFSANHVFSTNNIQSDGGSSKHLAQSVVAQGNLTPPQHKELEARKQKLANKTNITGKSKIIESNYPDKITKLGITLHPGSEYTSKDQTTSSSLNHCASLVYQALTKLPQEAVKELKDLTLYFADEGRRGLGGGSKIILRCSHVTDQEVVSVLNHEVGHIHDTGTFQGNFWAGESEFRDGKQVVYNDDPSVEFYRISFKDEKTRKDDSTDLDFVSGYATTDPFEDFAESYNYYILHGNEFRILAGENKILKKKYEFLKEKVFQGKEYFNGNLDNISNAQERNYDTTILSYDLSKFLSI